jgi:chromosome segregation ATPase
MRQEDANSLADDVRWLLAELDRAEAISAWLDERATLTKRAEKAESERDALSAQVATLTAELGAMTERAKKAEAIVVSVEDDVTKFLRRNDHADALVMRGLEVAARIIYEARRRAEGKP